MPYTQLDDGFYDHVETQEHSHAAVGLFVKALNYCGRQLTDGVIPAETMAFLARGRGGKQALKELQEVKNGVVSWLRRDQKRFFIDRYLDVTAPWGAQKSRAEVEVERERSRQRKAAERERKRQETLPWSGNGNDAAKGRVTP